MTTPDRQDDGLLPCPFCGSKAAAWMYDDMLFRVDCNGCSANVSGFDQNKQDAIDAWNTRAPSREAAEGAGRANLREAWSAMQMIRETVETLGPIGALPASEHLAEPTFMHEAEALVTGIRKMAAPPKPAPDAMREALRELLSAVKGSAQGYSRPGVIETWIENVLRPVIENAESVLAAPVPPAEGTGGRLPKDFGRKIEAAWDVEPTPFNRADVAVRIVNAHLSPSPAVAAEPVDRQNDIRPSQPR